MVIERGTCSKHPTPLCGRRVRVEPSTRKHEWPRVGDEGMIKGVTGCFVTAHDGVPELECVHVDYMSSFTILFDDGEQISGYPARALNLLVAT